MASAMAGATYANSLFFTTIPNGSDIPVNMVTYTTICAT
jgi:hypothetical protein